MSKSQTNSKKRLSAFQLIEHFGLTQAAHRAAMQGKPSSGERSMSPEEMTVIDAVEQRLDERADELRAHHNGIVAGAGTLSVEDTMPGSEVTKRGFVDQLVDLMRRRAPECAEVTAAKRSALTEYKVFQAEHGLCHTPRYAVVLWTQFAMLVAVVLMEAGINSFFFLSASPSGLLGAVATALTLGLLNVVNGAAAGMVPARWMRHCNHRHRYWCVTWLMVAAAFALFMAFGTAHYRAMSLTGGPFNTIDVVARMFGPDAFHLDLQSWGLALVSLLFAGVAGYKGFRSGDYPGYATKDRALQDANAQCHDLSQALTDEIEQTCLQYKDALNEGHETRSRVTNQLAGAANAFDAKRAAYHDLDLADVAALSDALDHYRKANLDVRTDNVVPAYFKDSLDMSSRLSANKTFQDLGPMLGQLFVQLQQSAGALAEQHALLSDIAEGAKEQITQLMDHLSQGSGDPAMLLSEIDWRATLLGLSHLSAPSSPDTPLSAAVTADITTADGKQTEQSSRIGFIPEGGVR